MRDQCLWFSMHSPYVTVGPCLRPHVMHWKSRQARFYPDDLQFEEQLLAGTSLRTSGTVKHETWGFRVKVSRQSQGSSIESGWGNSHLSLHVCCTQRVEVCIRGWRPFHALRRGGVGGWVSLMSLHERGALINVSGFIESASTPLTFACFYFQGLNVFW